MRTRPTTRAIDVFTATLLVGLSAIGLAAMKVASQTGSDEVDVLARKAQAQRLETAATEAQLAYVLERRKEGRKPVQTTLRELLEGHGIVFLNFWATYCPPCVEELPSLLALARTYPQMLILAVSYDESWDQIDDFMKKFTSEVLPENFLILLDRSRGGGRDLKALFGTEKIPESYLIKGNKVLLRFVGPRDWISPDVEMVLVRVAGLDSRAG